MSEKGKRGIVIIAVKNNLYARMAFNLSVSLRRADQGLLNICLIHDDTIAELNDMQRFNFNKRIKLTSEEASNPFLLKLNLDKLSPYDETIYLDADMLLCPEKKVIDLFNELSASEFEIANKGYISNTDSGYYWVDSKQMMEACKGTFLFSSSEFIYFKKGETSCNIFEQARIFYLTNSIVSKSIGGYQPDEPAFCYGIAESGYKCRTNFLPSFWEGHKQINFKEQEAYGHYFFSVGGAQVSDKSKGIYNRLLKGYSKGAAHFPYQSKRKNVPDRKLV